MRLLWSHELLSTRAPFRIANHLVTTKDVVVVRLEHDGIAGYGEAAASTFYGQTADAMLGVVGRLAGEVADACDPFDLLAALDRLVARYPAHPSTLAALDAATHDWIGKRLGLPVHRLLGIDARQLQPTAFSIGITEPAQAAAAARALAEAGHPVIKLKVGLPTLAEDYALVSAVREHAPAATLYLDANGGWPAHVAGERVAALCELGPALIEQPVAPGQLGALARITADSPVPIIADEDVLGPADVPRLWGVVSGVNIKITKCGGIRQALAMVHAARAGGLRVMLGCMIASSLGLAPAVQLAPLADYLDLDGHMLLAHDPWAGIGGAAGRLALTVQPGLGVARRG